MLAPAKLTTSLRVTGVRPDGYHLIDAEMVTLDLADELHFSDGDGLEVMDEVGAALPVPTDDSNLVRRALAAVGRKARVRLVKRIPAGGGLGGGSADAAAVLRWAGRGDDVALAATLGADVPFCLRGGRARVTGIGEVIEPLPVDERTFTLLTPPFGVSTAAVYRMWDDMARDSRDRPPENGAERANFGGGGGVNDLERAALAVEPRLRAWRDAFAEVAARTPVLAGSGSTWFVEGAIAGTVDGRPLVVTRTSRP